MKWASTYLNDDDYYSTCDDDMMVDLGLLQEYIEKYNDVKINNTWPEFPIICSYRLSEPDWGPIRKLSDKNYISKKEYKWTEWPKFCLGGMYSTSVGVIKQLLAISKTVKPLRTDDVWITGILRNIFGMPAFMLVVPKPPVAQHIEAYVKKSNKVATEEALKSWNDIYEKLRIKNICIC